MREFDLVIFDCDGVLVDSEVIFARVLGECLNEADFPATAAEALLLGFGKNRDTLAAAVERRYGRSLPDGFFEAMRARTARVLERELQPMPGVVELLTALPQPRCVASNGHLPRVRERLALTRLLRFFDPHVFSATQVAIGKPAPDLFLLAAHRLDKAPASCLVVEDSVIGVAAAVAAGMPVIGFCGGSHCVEDHAGQLTAAGCVQVFTQMADLATYLCDAKLCG
ncbi:MAG: HAD-IA family hydrolase [Alphaproteobacteria bacterium]|nr:HAD-IA family hydrolase [Alphaproteobacteria bacterium]